VSNLVNRKEFAAMMGVHPSQVSRALESGRIRLAKGTDKIDADQATIDWKRNNDSHNVEGINQSVPSIGKKRSVGKVKPVSDLSINAPDDDDDGDGDDKSLNAQKIRKTKADAERVELKLAQERGDLIAKDDVLVVYFTFLVALKNGIMAIPERIVGSIRAAVDEFADDKAVLDTKIYQILKEEHMRILTDIGAKIEEAEQEAVNIAKKYR